MKERSMVDFYIKFKQGDLLSLRSRLLDDLSKEQFAILLGKKVFIGSVFLINIIDIRFLNDEDYLDKGLTHLSLDKKFIGGILAEIQQRDEVDTLVDVHTHPFSSSHVGFSHIDDNDEKKFTNYLHKHFNDIHYASIVFSQTQYSARVWEIKKTSPSYTHATIKTQTPVENIVNSDIFLENRPRDTMWSKEDFLHRSVLALGVATMRSITQNRIISIVGVGGLGSIIAENLIHIGFSKINLIDNDHIEKSNLNRIVGASYADAINHNYKVDAIKNHLLKINPDAEILALRNNVYDKEIEKTIAISDWVFLATDNHSSRYRTQELCLNYFVPLISVGVNITVKDGSVEDMSGEVITVRVGDNLCLNCLGRINQTKVAFDLLPNEGIKEVLIDKGYISGHDVKEPAVKTLNSILASISVECLINQFTLRQSHRPILIFENNKSMAIYEDTASVKYRNLKCLYCSF